MFLGFGARLRFRVWSSGSPVLGFWVVTQSWGFRVQGPGLKRVLGLGLREKESGSREYIANLPSDPPSK